MYGFNSRTGACGKGRTLGLTERKKGVKDPTQENQRLVTLRNGRIVTWERG